jgi:catechol 2,3-dioxygenase-like lactoylglutathione lyase family enzyme
MIRGIEHIRLTVDDVAAVAADYAAVLGLSPDAPTAAGRPVRLDVGNTAIELTGVDRAGAGDGGLGQRLTLVFEVENVADSARRIERRGLAGTTRGDGAHGQAIHFLSPAATWETRLAIAAAAMDTDAGDGGAGASHDIAGLDHVVIRTPDPERAVALYGGRLGLDLRLDRTNESLQSRMLFFVCGDLVVEVVHDLKAGLGSGSDRVFGLAWRSADIERSHARMAAAGVPVSEVREGRRPGSRVFTVKGRTGGVPTLVIGGEGLARRPAQT